MAPAQHDKLSFLYSRKPLVCVFAHPDDESFGPGGTIALLAKTREVYSICVTNGDAGLYKGKRAGKDLDVIRLQELRNAARTLGVKKVFPLGFGDGMLANKIYHSLAKKIELVVKRIQPDTLLTFDPRGVSGHLDHIAVSMVTSFVFERQPSVKTLLYYCRSAARAKKSKGYFIYSPPGYEKSEIDATIDVRDTWNLKVEAMHQYESQEHDFTRILKQATYFPKEEYLLVRKK